MAKGNPSPNIATRFSSTYRPSPDNRTPAWSIQHALRRLMAQQAAGGKATNAERVASAWLKQAVRGNMTAIDKAAERIDGKVVDKQALTDAAGQDVQLDDRAFAVWLASKLAAPKAGKP